MIQSALWVPLKTVESGFVQGYTKDAMIELFKKGLGDDWRAISLDGSSFDAAQNVWVMEAVDDRFWRYIKPALLCLLQKYK